MDKDKLTHLKELAEKATPRPWHSVWLGINFCVVSTDEHDDNKSIAIEPISEEDAAYIAAANPQAVLKLIADYERLVAENEELRANNYGPEILNDPHALTTAYFEGMVAEGKQRNIKEDRLLAEKRLLEKEVDWFADKLSQASGSMFDDEMEKLGFQCSNECEGGVCAFECRKKNWREAARKAVE